MAEIFVIASRKACAYTVVFIHHTCYAVEPETIKMKFLYPEPQIAKQEPEDFMMAVVE
jgi:hypothetical protein